MYIYTKSGTAGRRSSPPPDSPAGSSSPPCGPAELSAGARDATPPPPRLRREYPRQTRLRLLPPAPYGNTTQRAVAGVSRQKILGAPFAILGAPFAKEAPRFPKVRVIPVPRFRQNVPKPFPNIPELFQRFRNFSITFPKIPDCSGRFLTLPELSGIFLNIPEVFQTFRKFPEVSGAPRTSFGAYLRPILETTSSPLWSSSRNLNFSSHIS